MLDFMASMIMATQVHCKEMKYSIKKHYDRGVAETIYQNNINKVDETEKYEKNQMPKSGYMTVDEYESLSRAKTKEDIEVTKPNMQKDSKMVYVPQKTYKLIKYNDPVGSPEITLPRKLNFDRQINAQGIISGDKTKLVYPCVYYYAQSDCTSCDLFLINLDSKLTDVEKVMQANIIQKEAEPLASTDKSVEEKYIFRTLTPIDFSTDNKNLVIKEKIGHRHDGIWKTELLVYNFEERKLTRYPQLRDAIVNYWANEGGVDFDEKRWDIYPMGYDENYPDRVLVCAYAYTGEVPKFLGTWSIDNEGQFARLESLDGDSVIVSTVGYRLVEDDVIDVSEVEFEAKRAEKIEKTEKKVKKKEEKFEKNIQKIQYQRTIRQMDMDTIFKLQEREKHLKELKKKRSKIDAVTGEQ